MSNKPKAYHMYWMPAKAHPHAPVVFGVYAICGKWAFRVGGAIRVNWEEVDCPRCLVRKPARDPVGAANCASSSSRGQLPEIRRAA